jgi:microsomal dipeptidase-like Zn-dependent dipeptidase
MNRREFLKYLSLLGATAALGKTSAYANWLTNEKRNGFPQGMLLIDAHAHPDQFYYMGPTEGELWETWCAQFCDDSSTLEKIMKLGMHGSSFAAIGDTQARVLTLGDVMLQIQKVINLEEQGLVRIVRRHRDMPHGSPPKDSIPGAILSLEGASPLGDNEDTAFENLDILYDCGVRMITLMHYLDNQFGQAMRKDREKTDGDGLSDLGKKVVKRMMKLGIVLDVAHAHYPTLRDIVKIAVAKGIPLIDSHTSLSPCEEFCGSRLRTWEEMEMVAATSGVICTWPLKWERADGSGRLTLNDWAEENYEMKERLGSQHIALGTDGGGVLPEMVEGYSSILDLPKLVEAMDEVGFKRSEIAAYMGGNLFRVIKQCIG